MKYRWTHPGLVATMACVALLALPGCLSRKPPTEGPSPPGTAADPAPPAQAATEASALRPGLAVNVTVLVAGKKVVEEVARNVADDGTLALPFLGTVPVDGLSPSQLGQDLTTRYREYYIDPQVIVEFARSEQPDAVSPWGSITVLGRVRRPGRVNIPATRDLTVSMAIQQAGGFDTSAKDTAILVTRRTPDGQTTTIRVNLRDVGARGHVEKDIVLQTDDVVYVPELVF